VRRPADLRCLPVVYVTLRHPNDWEEVRCLSSLRSTSFHQQGRKPAVTGSESPAQCCRSTCGESKRELACRWPSERRSPLRTPVDKPPLTAEGTGPATIPKTQAAPFSVSHLTHTTYTNTHIWRGEPFRTRPTRPRPATFRSCFPSNAPSGGRVARAAALAYFGEPWRGATDQWGKSRSHSDGKFPPYARNKPGVERRTSTAPGNPETAGGKQHTTHNVGPTADPARTSVGTGYHYRPARTGLPSNSEPSVSAPPPPESIPCSFLVERSETRNLHGDYASKEVGCLGDPLAQVPEREMIDA